MIADQPTDPIALFEHYLAQARAASARPYDATAVALATADARGRPAVRMVLLKGVDRGGFLFYTNYGSRKARDLAENPQAALCFYWPQLGIQVRVEGSISKLSDGESAAYFATRPRGSQLAAWASEQSAPLDDRGRLLARYAEVEQRFIGTEVGKPPNWGGYRLEPSHLEFWADVPSRMHDRLAFDRAPSEASATGSPTWHRTRLFP